jgi:hypothetical protein
LASVGLLWVTSVALASVGLLWVTSVALASVGLLWVTSLRVRGVVSQRGSCQQAGVAEDGGEEVDLGGQDRAFRAAPG